METLINGVSNSSAPPSFMLNDGEYAYLGFRMVCENDGEGGNLYVYQFLGKENLLFSDVDVSYTVTNQVDANCFILRKSHDETAEVWKNIKDRLTYLDDIFDEEENRETYQSTKRLLLDVLRCFRLKKYPSIGIDDNGQAGASWHNGRDYKIISIIPRHENNISISCITKSDKILRSKTTLPRIKSDGIEELTKQLAELPW